MYDAYTYFPDKPSGASRAQNASDVRAGCAGSLWMNSDSQRIAVDTSEATFRLRSPATRSAPGSAGLDSEPVQASGFAAPRRGDHRGHLPTPLAFGSLCAGSAGLH